MRGLYFRRVLVSSGTSSTAASDGDGVSPDPSILQRHSGADPICAPRCFERRLRWCSLVPVLPLQEDWYGRERATTHPATRAARLRLERTVDFIQRGPFTVREYRLINPSRARSQ